MALDRPRLLVVTDSPPCLYFGSLLRDIDSEGIDVAKEELLCSEDSLPALSDELTPDEFIPDDWSPDILDDRTRDSRGRTDF
jgi:hypothetical protein